MILARICVVYFLVVASLDLTQKALATTVEAFSGDSVPADVQQSITDVAEKAAIILKEHDATQLWEGFSAKPTSTDLVGIVTRALATGTGIFMASMNTSTSPEVALSAAAAGALVTMQTQYLHIPYCHWQTHWVRWTWSGIFRGHQELKSELGPLGLVGKEFLLQTFFWSIIEITSRLTGDHFHFSSTLSHFNFGSPFFLGWRGLISDGLANIVLMRVTVGWVESIKKSMRNGNSNLAEGVRRISVIRTVSKGAASLISVFCTTVLAFKYFGSPEASAILNWLSPIFGGAFLGVVVKDFPKLKKEIVELTSLPLRASRKGVSLAKGCIRGLLELGAEDSVMVPLFP